MTNHHNRAKIGILKTSQGRTAPSYAVLKRLPDGRLCTCMAHYDVGVETRVAYHNDYDYDAAQRRFDKLELDAALRR
jgi:hypothetical protein